MNCQEASHFSGLGVVSFAPEPPNKTDASFALGLDSVELLFAIDTAFDVEITDAEASELRTPGDIHREAAEIHEIASELRTAVLRWLEKKHPSLLRST